MLALVARALTTKYRAKKPTEKGCTPAQLALAWLLRRPDVVPTPGSSSIARLAENVRAVEISLTESDMAQIEQAVPKGSAVGSRYSAAILDLVDG
jgi:aryl-alcohol dehydrogenase-like predicted oxidoreductase